VAHWLEELEEYETVHRQGKLYGNADALSRFPQADCQGDVSLCVSSVKSTTLLSVYSPQEVWANQLNDDLVGPFLTSKEQGGQPPTSGNGPKMIQLRDKLCVRNGVLYRVDNNALNVVQRVVPKSLQDKILSGIHEGVGGGHLGVEKFVAKLKKQFYWPGHYNDVKNWCSGCSSCLARKTAVPHNRAPLQPVKVSYPLEMVAVDIMGPFSMNASGNHYILVAEDYFTRWLEA